MHHDECQRMGKNRQKGGVSRVSDTLTPEYLIL